MGTRYLGGGGGGGFLVGLRFMIHSDPWRGGVSAKVRSTIPIKKSHDRDQKVHLPIYEQHNKRMVLFNSMRRCDEFEVRKTETMSTLVIRNRSKLSGTFFSHASGAVFLPPHHQHYLCFFCP